MSTCPQTLTITTTPHAILVKALCTDGQPFWACLPLAPGPSNRSLYFAIIDAFDDFATCAIMRWFEIVESCGLIVRDLYDRLCDSQKGSIIRHLQIHHDEMKARLMNIESPGKISADETRQIERKLHEHFSDSMPPTGEDPLAVQVQKMLNTCEDYLRTFSVRSDDA